VGAGFAQAGSVTTDVLTVHQTTLLHGQVTIATSTNIPVNIPSNGIVLAYAFDSNTTPAPDGSTNGNNGTVSGATWTNGGRFGGGYTFDGTNDYIQASDSASLDIGGPLTISAWARFDASNSVRALVSKNNDASARAYNAYFEGGVFYFQITSGGSGSSHYSIGSGVSVSSAQWTHYVVTWDGTLNSHAQMYVNGTPISVSTLGASMSGTNIYNSSEPVRVGSKSNGSWHFAGAIDEVYIYNRALNLGEIAALYAGGAGTNVPTVNATSLLVGSGVSATFSGTTTITRLTAQGDISMGDFKNGP
jgi:hypothetical protein